MEPETPPPIDEASDLRHGPPPPAALEARVVSALRGAALVRPRPHRWWATMAAASLACFVAGASAGYLIARQDAPIDAPSQTRSRYMLLLAGDVTPAADGSSRAEEYGAWARGLLARGIAVRGDELSSHAEVIGTRSAAAFADLAGIGGYFVIDAKNDAEASALARTCPHVKYGGSIVVRRLE